MRWLLTLLFAFSAPAWGAEFGARGNLALEYRYFPDPPADPAQHGSSGSLSFEPDLHWSWNDGDDAVTFRPFARIDGGDDRRSHGDIRELLWLHLGDRAAWRIGIGQVFWGVTESQHLVDIVNQTDLVEDIDGEEKLGQPMAWGSWSTGLGVFDLLALPGFRERTFPGREGRLRTSPPVDEGQAVYQSAAGSSHVDLAARWSHYVGVFDFGLSVFDGTSREPRLEPGMDDAGRTVLVPHYDQVTQVGLDGQATVGPWLWKLEWIRRLQDAAPDYSAATGGLEYTFSGVFGSRYDLGLLIEYLYDDRDQGAGPFDDDVFAALRLALNDADGSEVLAGVIADRDTDARVFNLEASRRLSNQWKLSLEARVFSGIPDDDPLASRRNDDYLQLRLGYYF